MQNKPVDAAIGEEDHAGGKPATPRPWFLHDFTGAIAPPHEPSPGDVTISCDHPATITVAFMGRALTATVEEARANAELIVRAVNAHDDLVAALERLVKAQHADRYPFDQLEPKWRQAVTALAKASPSIASAREASMTGEDVAPADNDAERRLTLIRYQNEYAPICPPGHDEIVFLLRLLDSRNAALREAQHQLDLRDEALREAQEEIEAQVAHHESHVRRLVEEIEAGRAECERLRAALHNTLSLLRAFVTRDDDIARATIDEAEVALARPQPATHSSVPPQGAGRTLEQRAWAIVHEHGPAWRNDYMRRFPNSKSSERTKSEEMAHYCVVAALREMSPSPSDAATDGGQPEAAMDEQAFKAAHGLAACSIYGSKVIHCALDPKCPWHGQCPATVTPGNSPAQPSTGDVERARKALKAARVKWNGDFVSKYTLDEWSAVEVAAVFAEIRTAAETKGGDARERVYHAAIWQDGIAVAHVSSPDQEATRREALHYAMVYGQDGPVQVRYRTTTRARASGKDEP